jgi:hypothetical protein
MIKGHTSELNDITKMAKATEKTYADKHKEEVRQKEDMKKQLQALQKGLLHPYL